MEEARKRDHRKLGKELDLYSQNDEVGQGLILWHPNGGMIRLQIERFWEDEHMANGYDFVYTPHIGKASLWETSGHLGFYKENMYSPIEIEGQQYYIKPMNCPFHILIYKTSLRSYRELPLRWAELGTVYRYERSGVLHGLMRVRCFTQDDAHLYCRPDQVKDEIKGIMDLCRFIYKDVFGFKYTMELSTRPDNSMGSEEQWKIAETALQQALEETGSEYKLNPGDGAFYGPKIDFHLEDSIGRTWQCGTIQLDMNLPERFDLTYTGADGEKHRPVMIHRVAFGSIERFIGILTEHFAGAFPLWIAPVQAKVLTITDRADGAALALQKKLEAAGIRTEIDLRNEKIGFKIREAQVMKIPYMLVVGDKEAEEGTVAVRYRGQGDIGTMPADELLGRMLEEIRTRAK